MFKLLSAAFMPPTEELGRNVASGALCDAIKESWQALELDQQLLEQCTAQLEPYRGRNAEEVMHELRRESTRLFLGDRPLVTNSEGPWRKRSEGKTGIVLMINSYSTEIADFMRLCGVVRPQGYNDCVDYIENELDFAGFLAESPAYLEEKNLDAFELLNDFTHKHLKVWIPSFCDDVAQTTKAAYYKAISALCKGFVESL